MNDSIDHQARALAQAAVDRIAAHEGLCGERWRQARDEIQRVRTDIGGLKAFIAKFMWWFLGGSSGAIILIILWLADRAFK